MATDLKAFEARLNSDTSTRSQFLEDPVGSLEAEGLILSDEAKENLIDFVDQLKNKRPPLQGSDELGIILNIQHRP